MAKFEVTRYHGSPVENTKLDFGKLYLRQIYSGTNSNQSVIIDGDAGSEFGKAAVNDWGIYDGPGQDAELVARARGIHVNAVDFYNSFVMVFVIERFKGSTLEVMGATIEGQGDWAIVGGTGHFAMARGVIERTKFEKTADGEVHEFIIDAFCRTKLQPPTKMGPWGGNGGSVRDLTEIPQRLESVTIRWEGVVDSFAFTYIDQAGKTQNIGTWGAGGPKGATTTKIQLGPSEIVTAISGTIGKIFKTTTVITSLKIVTNVETYGPFGNPSFDGAANNKPFSTAVPKDKSIVGFFGRSDKFIDSIGVYTV